MRKSKSKSQSKGFKSMNCKYCGSKCERVDINATAITCWKCTLKLVNGEVLEVKK